MGRGAPCAPGAIRWAAGACGRGRRPVCSLARLGRRLPAQYRRSDADGLVHALDAATGKRKPQWPAVTGTKPSLPVCVHSDVVIAAAGDRVYGIDVPTGERRWRRRLEETVNGLALGGGSVVACAQSSVCALTVGDGHVRWQTRLKGTPGAPSIAGDVVVVPSGSPHRLHAVSLQTGRRLWDIPLTSEPSCAPAVAGDRLLITAGGSIEVFAFERTADG